MEINQCPAVMLHVDDKGETTQHQCLLATHGQGGHVSAMQLRQDFLTVLASRTSEIDWATARTWISAAILRCKNEFSGRFLDTLMINALVRAQTQAILQNFAPDDVTSDVERLMGDRMHENKQTTSKIESEKKEDTGYYTAKPLNSMSLWKLTAHAIIVAEDLQVLSRQHPGWRAEQVFGRINLIDENGKACGTVDFLDGVTELKDPKK